MGITDITPPMGTSLDEIMREKSRVMRATKRQQPPNPWKVAGLVLTVVVGTGAVIGALGKAFYVTRDEYTTKTTNDAVINSKVSDTLVRIEGLMREQQSASEKLTGDLSEVKTDIAVIRSRSKTR